MNDSFIRSFIMLCSFDRIRPGRTRPVSIVHFPLGKGAKAGKEGLERSEALIRLFLSNFYDVEPWDLSDLVPGSDDGGREEGCYRGRAPVQGRRGC
jgi:hypothetical protein